MVDVSRSWTQAVEGGQLHIETDVNAVGAAEVRLKALDLGEPTQLQFHWAVITNDNPDEWQEPPPSAGTTVAVSTNAEPFGDGIATRSAFAQDGTLNFSIPDTSEIQAVVGIVVRNGDEWLHADGGDLRFQVAPRRSDEVLMSSVRAERGGELNLLDRFRRTSQGVGEAAGEPGPEGAAAIFTTLRLSASRQLPWYEGSNYQGKDMAHTQEYLATIVADATVNAKDPIARQLFRESIRLLPRGGGNGDDIRLGILQIMRENGIKEGHRPGIECQFIAQWHQKLHSNTTPDDISICEAYLHFLHTGMWDDFWDHLWENARLTRDDLEGMKAGWRTSGITGPAVHLPHMIPAMQHFHWILTTTHSGGGLDSTFQFARGEMPEDLQWEVDDLLKNRDEWWVPGKIVDIRERLSGHIKAYPNRDVVRLDVALERFFRTRVEAMDVGALSPDDVLANLELVCRNGIASGDADRLAAAAGFLMRAQASDAERWSSEWALTMDAALDSVALAVEHELDALCDVVQPCADEFGDAVESVEESFVLNFGEETARGHPLFVASAFIGAARPLVREAAGLSSWQVVSGGAPGLEAHAGRCRVALLSDLQGQDLSAESTVVLSESLGGLEDVPPGVTAVLSAAPVDLLSHIAIRARNTGVLLATVTDPAVWASLVAYEGQNVRLTKAGDGEVLMEPSLPEACALVAAAGAGVAGSSVTLQRPPNFGGAWVVNPAAYSDSVVGNKSRSLTELAARASELGLAGVRVPGSVAVPFRAFEAALAKSKKSFLAYGAALEALAMADASGDAEARRGALREVRHTVRGVPMPKDAAAALADATAAGSLGAAGAALAPEQLFRAVKDVWASKWTERAFLSRAACNAPDEDLSMAALLMELVDAEYAFVLHTRDPVTGDSGTVAGEVCVGLGETLVGNEPGRALSFACGKAPGSACEVRSLPSKPAGRFAPAGGTVIARSDSNGEDLEGFAGAGLYDSVTVMPTEERVVHYGDVGIVWDAAERESLARRLTEVAAKVEEIMGAPQDIEGAIVGGEIVLLQTRAQV